MSKIEKQLVQFQLRNFEDWTSEFPLPIFDALNLEINTGRNKYVPKMGEICGVIIKDDTERAQALPVIPDAYQDQPEKYTVLKMGDGITEFWYLPWTNIIDKNVVNNLVNQLFANNEEQNEGFIQTLNTIIHNSMADWEENDPTNHSFIKNRICSAVYEPVADDTPIVMPEIQVDMEYEPNIIKKYFGTCELGDIDEETYEMFHEMDKYEISIYNSVDEEYSHFMNTLTYIGNASTESGEAIIYGFGNTSSFANLVQIATNQMISFTGEVTTDPFGLILIFITDPNSLERYGLLLFYCDESLVTQDEDGDFSSLISFKYKEKCTSINPISSRWLPQSIKAHSDWNALSYEDPGYIKNKICSVIAYEEASRYEGKYLNNQIVYFTDNLILGDNAFLIPDFGPINSLNKYRIALDDEEMTAQFFELQSINNQGQVDSNPIYLLGNVYLYVKFLYDLCVSLGVMPLFVMNLMSSIEDNGMNFCFLCTPQGNDLQVGVMYRPDAEKYKGQKNIDLSYTLISEGNILLNNNNITRIVYDNNIFDEIINNTNHFIDENNEYGYYVLFEDQGIEKPFRVASYGKDSETNKYYIELVNSPGYISGTVIPKLIIVREDAIKYIDFNLELSPMQIKTIDPVWIPAELKVGQYEDYDAYDISAEIFNDYNDNHAYGAYSHAEGRGTIANGNYQHVQGKFNIPTEDNDESIAFIIGNGSEDVRRSNAYTLDFQGNSKQAGVSEASDFKANNHYLSQKEDSSNKIKTLSPTDNEEVFPTSQAVQNYLNSIFDIEFDANKNIVLNITSIDGNGLYGNPFIDK